jgi:hypothetical protein
MIRYKLIGTDYFIEAVSVSQVGPIIQGIIQEWKVGSNWGFKPQENKYKRKELEQLLRTRIIIIETGQEITINDNDLPNLKLGDYIIYNVMKDCFEFFDPTLYEDKSKFLLEKRSLDREVWHSIEVCRIA